jgi:hypothetical protein
MALTFTIGDVDFEALDATAGRKAINCDAGYPKQSVHRFHLPGTTGNLKILGGTQGREMRFIVRYQAANDGALLDLLNADVAEWSDADLTVTDDNNNEYERCTVRTVQRVGRMKATGHGVRLDVEITVDCDS